MLFGKLGTLVWRDLRAELRTREILTATLVFPPLVLMVFRFSFDVGVAVDLSQITPGILWSTLAFAGVLSLGRSFAAEKEDERWLGLLLAPVERGTLYLSKTIANTLYLCIIAAVTLPVYELFFSAGVFVHIGPMLLVLLLGLIGIASAGTLLAAMAVNTRAREALLPLLMFPVLSPVLIGVVEATQSVLKGWGLSEVSHWLWMLVAVDVLFLCTGWLLFEFIVEE